MKIPYSKEANKIKKYTAAAGCFVAAFFFLFSCSNPAASQSPLPSSALAASAAAPITSPTRTASSASHSATPAPLASAVPTGTGTPGNTASQDSWQLILVNPSHRLPADFKVQPADFQGGQVDARILDICVQMFADAKKAGAQLKLVDAYRSRDRQNELYQQKVNSYIAKGYSRSDAEVKAATITARPDTSEHQTGLALDIVSPSYTARDSGFAQTKAFAWLNTNAQKYGFILRYNQNKEPITKVIYEPWHWRYVGTAAAAQMKKSGECLEEYLNELD